MDMSEKEGDNEKSKAEAVTPAAVISEQERELAQTALADFTKASYGQCLLSLSKLETCRPQDTKVAHNKAIAEYYKSELKKTDQFRKNMNIVCSQAHINIEDLDSLEDVEHCVIYYNQAVLLYHLKQYGTALRIMNKIFSFIEPMEESLAHRVCLLLVELHLCTFQLEKALSLIAYIENQFVSTETVISSDKDVKPLEKEHKEKKPVSVDAATDAFHLKLLRYRARCYLMTHSLKACKREIKNVVTSGGRNMASAFLKSNLEYLRGNYRKAIKALNSVPQPTLPFKESGEVPTVLFYNNNACIHHYMGKPNLACFYLQKALQENEAALRSLPKPDPGEPYSGRPLYTLGANRRGELLFNLGVCLLHTGKPLQAFDCLTEAVQIFHTNPRLWLRLAECCIMAHKAGNEHDFNVHVRRNDLVQQVVGAGFHRKVVLSDGLSRDGRYSHEGQSYAIPVATVEFASLCLRNALLLLPPPPSGVAPADAAAAAPQQQQQPPAAAAGDEPSSSSSSEAAAAPEESPAAPAREVVTCAAPAPPSAPLGQGEVGALRCSVLAASAYVALCLGDCLVALGHAQRLLQQPRLSGVHKLLGHLYCAEAYVMLDKISEAMEHLHPDGLEDLSPAPAPPADKDKDDMPTDQCRPLRPWFPSSMQTAKALLQYNLAVAFAIRGELDKAGETLKQVWLAKSATCDIPIHVIMLALYIELQLGHADVARSIVKQHTPHIR